MLLTAIPLPGYAAAGLVLSAESVTADCTPGETVRMPVRADENAGYAAGIIDVAWNSDMLTLTGVTYDAALAPENDPAPIDGTSGTCRLAFGSFTSTESFTGTGEFFVLEFTVNEGAKAGSYPVTLTDQGVCAADASFLQTDLTGGTVTLTEKPDMQLTAGSATAAAGDGGEIRVPVTAETNPGYAVGLVNVSWDADALILKAVEYNAALAPANQPAPVKNSGSYRVSFGDYLATENYTGTGELFTLVFTVSENAEAKVYPITFSKPDFVDKDLNNITAACENGAVTLGSSMTTAAATTSALAATTSAPVTTTAAVTSSAPVTTTATATTSAPVTTTAAATTSAPVTTTAAATTSAPVTATAAATTSAPVTTTAAATTSVPVTTTAAATTSEKVTTTAAATTSAPVTTAADTTSAGNTTSAVTGTTEAAQIVLHAETVSCKLEAGKEIRVPVTADSSTGYAVGLVNVSWNADALILKAVEYNAELAPANQPAEIKNSGSYRVCFGDFLAAENFTGTGVLFTLIFTVSENAEATVYPITFSKPDFLDKDMNTVTVSCTDGAVTLESGTEPDVLRGDTDCNGEVSIEDVQLALQAYTMHVSGKDTGLTDKQFKAADVNENGDLSVDDVQNILIYYVNNTVAGKKLTWEELLGDQPQPRPDVLKARAS